MYFLIDFLLTVTQAFVLSWCEAEQRVVVWALAGCNLSQAAVCGNYLLHGSAVGNRYLYPGCQTIGFPPRRSPILDDLPWCVREYVHSVRADNECACVQSQLCVLSSCLPTCVKVKNVFLAHVAVCRRGKAMLPLEMRSKRAQAGDSRSATLPEQLCPL